MAASALVLGALAVSTGACNGAVTEPGSLFIAMSTDMVVPEGLDTVGFYVWQIHQDGRAVRIVSEEVAPIYNAADGTYRVYFPATFVVQSAGGNDERVRLQLVGRRSDGTAAGLREVITRVPHSEQRLVRMPILWINDGSAESPTEADGPYVSSCGVDRSHGVYGECVESYVDPEELPMYQADEGWTGIGARQCFDLGTVFAEGAPSRVVELDAVRTLEDGSCEVTLPWRLDPARTNVAWLSNAAGDFEVPQFESRRLRPIQPEWGFTTAGNTLRFRPAWCRKLAALDVQQMVVSRRAANWNGEMPICAPWTVDVIEPNEGDLSEDALEPESPDTDAGVDAAEPDATTNDAGPDVDADSDGGLDADTENDAGADAATDAVLDAGPVLDAEVLDDAAVALPEACGQVATGLVAHFTANDTLRDEVSGSSASTTDLLPALYAAGHSGRAFAFSGLDDLGRGLTFPVAMGSRLTVHAGVTLRAWVYPAVAQHQDIVGRDGESSNRIYLLNMQAGGNVRAHVGVGQGFQSVDSVATLQPNVWREVAMSYDAITGRLAVFVDGAVSGEMIVQGGQRCIAASSEPLRIGGGANALASQYFYNGRIDEVRVYDYALPDEALAH